MCNRLPLNLVHGGDRPINTFQQYEDFERIRSSIAARGLQTLAGVRMFVPERVERGETEWIRIIGYTAGPIVSIAVALTAIF